jgi:hypothetical protein
MSLKAFHLVFIVASILLSSGFGVWCFMNYFSAGGNGLDLSMGAGSVIAVIALIVYEVFFLKKMKNVSYL